MGVVECQISFEGELTPERVGRLGEIPERCPVHRTLTSETKAEQSWWIS